MSFSSDIQVGGFVLSLYKEVSSAPAYVIFSDWVRHASVLLSPSQTCVYHDVI